MRRPLQIALAFVFLAVLSAESPQTEVIRCSSDDIRAELKNCLGETAVGLEIRGTADRICSFPLPEFYKNRDYAPAWSSGGNLSAAAKDFVQAIEQAGEDGLRPEDYHLAAIQKVIEEMKRAKRRNSISRFLLAQADILLTDAFFLYASHLSSGKVDPETMEANWTGTSREVDAARLLDEALDSQAVGRALRCLSPQHMLYAGLREQLPILLRKSGRSKWRPMPAGPDLKKGDKGHRVRLLTERLISLKELPSLKSREWEWAIFGACQEDALKRLQSRHGLAITGVLDQTTLTVLNISPEDRAGQVKANMERWRWLPPDLSGKIILVDIADFKLTVCEDFRKILEMKVVVGSHAWQTPVFASRMTHIIINPSWTAPANVLLRELSNYIREDPEYLARNKMKLIKGYDREETEVDPVEVKWEFLNEKNLDFRLRQEPGPLNILGRLKFLFPNRYDIYLHDTPYQEDFGKSLRMFSHGCIRAEKPVDLACYLLADDKRGTKKGIQARIDEGREQALKLKDPVLVLVVYGTAWAGESEGIEFRPDVYGRDRLLLDALGRERPVPSDTGCGRSLGGRLDFRVP